MTLLHDFRLAVRLLAKQRAFTFVAVMALALGIGVNNTFFTLVNAMCLRGPIDDPAGLVHLGTRGPAGAPAGMSYADFEDARAAMQTMEGMAAYANTPVAIADDERGSAAGALADTASAAGALTKAAERVTAAYVSANAFALINELPVAGRGFTAADDRAGAEPVAILANALWMSRYGADPDVIGRAIRINGTSVTVIGVMREDFGFPNDASVWLPLASMPGLAAQPRTVRTLGVFGRLRDGISMEQARSDLDGLMTRAAASAPATNTGITGRMAPINEWFTANITDPAWIAFITAGTLVLLIACANVANLLLARGLGRSGEMAIRTSLGASRARVVRQLLVESGVLALAGGVTGLALSFAGVRLLSVMIPEGTLPSWMELRMDGRVFAMLAIVCLGTVFVFGFVPAVLTSKTTTRRLLSERTGGGAGGRGARWWTTGFLTAEFALTFVPLTLLAHEVRSLADAQREERVIDTANLLTASLTLPPERYRLPEDRIRFYDRIVAQTEAAGAAAASLATWLPFSGAAPRRVLIDGRPPAPNRPLPSVSMIAVAPRYFQTVGARVIHGREFSWDDGREGNETVVVNERFAAMHFPDGAAVGSRIQLASDTPSATEPWRTIVGISPAIRQVPSTEPGPVVYLPIRSTAPSTIAILVRGREGSNTAAAILRDQVRALDPDLPLFRVRSMDQVLADAGWNGRVASTLIKVIAATGLFLALVGLYAVTSYAVTSRKREIGVRMAVGARAVDVALLVMRRAMLHLSLGALAGIGCAFAWDQVLGNGSTPLAEPAILLAVTVAVGVVGAAAAFVPARRATRIDPVAALRAE